MTILETEGAPAPSAWSFLGWTVEINAAPLTTGYYTITLTGEQIVTQAEPAAEGETSGAPQIEQIMPRVYGKAIPILAISLGILALGFTLLYRSNAPKEATNERSRR